MPSSLHQTLVDLLRHAPAIVTDRLHAAGAAAGAIESLRPLDAVLDQLERRVDLAIEVQLTGLGPLAIGLEVQLNINPAKRRSWPVYVTTLRSEACPRALLVVLTPSAAVARWAARPIDLGPCNESFRVHVIGPEQIPRVTEVEAARRSPELAVLSALAHAAADRDPGLVRVAFAGLQRLDSARRWSYGSALIHALDAATRAALEVTMTDTDTQPDQDAQPEVSRELFERAMRWGHSLWEEEQARKAAREQGRSEGRDEGRIEARREVLRHLLARAGLRLDVGEAARIDACTELARLDRWIDQAITASTVAEALAEP